MSLDLFILEEFDTALALRWQHLLQVSIDREPASREDVENEVENIDAACLSDGLEIADWLAAERGLTRSQTRQLRDYVESRCGGDEPLTVRAKRGRGRPKLTPRAELARGICARRAAQAVAREKTRIRKTRPGRRVTQTEARAVVAEKVWPTGRKLRHARGRHDKNPWKDVAELVNQHWHHEDLDLLD